MSLSFRDRQARRRVILGTLAAAPAALFATDCLAQADVRIEADASVFLSDNPFLLTGTDRAAGAVEFVARPEVDWTIAPATTLKVAGTAAVRQYHRRYGHYVTGGAEATFRHRQNEFLSLSSLLRYTRQLPTDALTDSIDAAIDTRSVRENLTARSSIDWTPNATTTINANLGAERMHYSDSPLLSTTKAYDLGLALSKRVSTLMSVGVRTQLTVSNSANFGESSAKTFRLTASRRLESAWRADAEFGVELTSMPGQPGEGRDRRTRFSGSANLCYEPRRFTACLSASLRSEVSGFSNLQRESALDASLTGRLSERGSLTATAGYRRARLGGFDSTTDLMHLSTRYEHRLTERFSLRAGVDYLHRTRVTGEKTGAVIFQIGVTFRGQGR